MTYHLTAPAPLFQPNPGWQGLGALGAVSQQVAPACQAWIQEHYNLAEYERIRRNEIPALLAELAAVPMPAPVGQPALRQFFAETPMLARHTVGGAPVTVTRPGGEAYAGGGRVSGLGLLGLLGLGAGTLRGDMTETNIQQRYEEWINRYTNFIIRAADTLKRMAAAINTRPYWLLPTIGVQLATDVGDQVLVTHAQPELPPVSFYGKLKGSPSTASAVCFSDPVAASWRHIPFDVIGSAEDPAHYVRSDIRKFWADFHYTERARGGGSARTGYPPGFNAWDVPPAVVNVIEHGSATSAERSSKTCQLWLGPQYNAWYVGEVLKIVAARPAREVLGNAYTTYGKVLEVWAGAPGNPSSANVKDRMKVAGMQLQLAGQAFTSAGTVATASGVGAVAGIPLAVFGAVLSILGEIYKILPNAKGTLSACANDPRKDNRNRVYWNGAFCGPPPPLVIKPPEGCTPADVLTQLDKPLFPRKWWEYLTHPAVLAGVGAVLAIGAYRAFKPKTTNRRRYRRKPQ